MDVNKPTTTSRNNLQQAGSLKDYLTSPGMKQSLSEAMPKHNRNVDRFVKSALLEINSNAKLQSCTKESIFKCMIESASYGLEVGGVLGQAYMIPYENNAQFQMGYKGLLALARRSETIKTISAEVVYQNDDFEVELGMGRNLTHKINITKERGNAIAYYCLVELVNGGFQFAVMSKAEIEKHRDKFSKAAKFDSSVWKTDFDAMAKKTVLIQALKLCPISVEALEAVNREELKSVGEAVPEKTEFVNMDDVETIDSAEIIDA